MVKDDSRTLRKLLKRDEAARQVHCGMQIPNLGYQFLLMRTLRSELSSAARYSTVPGHWGRRLGCYFRLNGSGDERSSCEQCDTIGI
jgi:hypothetical protein